MFNNVKINRRAASGGDSDTIAVPIAYAPQQRYLEKFCSYFDIYDKHFHKFKGRTPNILEIGVNMGGSLEMWGIILNGTAKYME